MKTWDIRFTDSNGKFLSAQKRAEGPIDAMRQAEQLLRDPSVLWAKDIQIVQVDIRLH